MTNTLPTFGDLRALLHNTTLEHEAWRTLLAPLLKRHHELCPEVHFHQWIPHLEQSAVPWKSFPLTNVSTLAELAKWHQIAPFAYFSLKYLELEAFLGFNSGYGYISDEGHYISIESDYIQENALIDRFDSAHLHTLLELHMNETQHNVKFFEVLSQHNTLSSVSKLSLQNSDLTDAHLAALTRSSSLTSITSLNMMYNNICTDGIKALASSTSFHKLTHLNLSHNKLSGKSIKALSQAPFAPHLTHLDLSYNVIRDAGLDALTQNFHSLTHLNLQETHFTAAGIQALAQAKALRSLQTLDLSEMYLPPEMMLALAHSPHFEHLNDLRIDDYNYFNTCFDLDALLELPKLPPAMRRAWRSVDPL